MFEKVNYELSKTYGLGHGYVGKKKKVECLVDSALVTNKIVECATCWGAPVLALVTQVISNHKFHSCRRNES